MIGLTPPSLPTTALTAIKVATTQTDATTTATASNTSITDTVTKASALPPVDQSLSLPSTDSQTVAQSTSNSMMNDMKEESQTSMAESMPKPMSETMNHKYLGTLFSDTQVDSLTAGVSVNAKLEDEEVTFLPMLDNNQIAALKSGKSITVKNEDGKNYILSSLPTSFEENSDMMKENDSELKKMEYVTLRTQDGQTRKAMFSPMNLGMPTMEMNQNIAMELEKAINTGEMATSTDAINSNAMKKEKYLQSSLLSSSQMSSLSKGVSVNIGRGDTSITLIPSLTSNQQAALQSGKNLPIQNEDGKQYYVRSYNALDSQSSASSIDEAITSSSEMTTLTLSSFDGETRKAIVLPSMHSDMMKSMSSYTYQATNSIKSDYSSLYA